MSEWIERLENPEINWVAQEEASGCVAAVLAMMLRCDYWSAAKLLDKYEGDDACYSPSSRQTVLFDKGWAKLDRGVPNKYPDGSKIWPPVPFAPVHIVSVKIGSAADMYHSVIWLRNGDVLDPMTPHKKSLSHYAHVGGIEGWTPLPPPTPCRGEVKMDNMIEREKAIEIAEHAAQLCRDNVARCEKWSAVQGEWSRARDIAMDIADNIRALGKVQP